MPLPLWLAAAGLAVALSFVVFALALRHAVPAVRQPRRVFLRLHRGALGALRAASVCVLLLIIAAGLFGSQDPFRNIAPALVWIAWWIGFSYFSALAGDLWQILSPWNALYLCAEAINRKVRTATGFGLQLQLPVGVGAWPAALLLLVFAWFEIVDRKSTRLNSSHIQKSRMPSSA